MTAGAAPRMRRAGWRPSRIALVVVALAAMAWLGAGLRAAREESRAIALTRSGGPAATARAEALFLRAAEHGPSTRPELRLAQLRVFDGRPQAARPVLERIVRREPENAEAWILLAQVTARADPARAAEARTRVRALRPRPDARRG